MIPGDGITFRIDTDALVAELTDIGKRQAPYAISKGLNATALDWQAAQRVHFRRSFTVRRPAFIDRLAKIEKFSRKTDLLTRFGISGPRAEILTKFELGGARPVQGTHVALPIEAKRNRADIIPRNQRPRALRSAAEARRVFVIRSKKGVALLLQRYGRKKTSRTRVLYAFTPAAGVHLPASLGFERIAMGVLNGRAVQHIRDAFASVLVREMPMGQGYSVVDRGFTQ